MLLRKRRRHSAAVSGHVADLAAGQPELQHQPATSATAKAMVIAQGGRELHGECRCMAAEFRPSATMAAWLINYHIALLSKSDKNLVWLDCEMTGLEPDHDRIIEIAVIVTGPHLEHARRRPGVRDPPERRPARPDGRLEQGHPRQEWPDRQGQGVHH